MKTVAVIGDSQAQGLVVYGNISDQLVRQGAQFVGGFQSPGADTRRIISELDKLFNVTIPDAVIVTAGGNESPGEARSAAWTELVTRLFAGGVREVYWVSPPASPDPVRDSLRAAVSEAQKPVVEAAGATWISGRVTADGLPRRDDVHLTSEGYRVWAQRIAESLGGRLRSSYVPVVIGLAGLAAAYFVRQYRGPLLLATAAITGVMLYRQSQASKAPQLPPR